MYIYFMLVDTFLMKWLHCLKYDDSCGKLESGNDANFFRECFVESCQFEPANIEIREWFKWFVKPKKITTDLKTSFGNDIIDRSTELKPEDCMIAYFFCHALYFNRRKESELLIGFHYNGLETYCLWFSDIKQLMIWIFNLWTLNFYLGKGKISKNPYEIMDPGLISRKEGFKHPTR